MKLKLTHKFRGNIGGERRDDQLSGNVIHSLSRRGAIKAVDFPYIASLANLVGGSAFFRSVRELIFVILAFSHCSSLVLILLRVVIKCRDGSVYIWWSLWEARPFMIALHSKWRDDYCGHKWSLVAMSFLLPEAARQESWQWSRLKFHPLRTLENTFAREIDYISRLSWR